MRRYGIPRRLPVLAAIALALSHCTAPPLAHASPFGRAPKAASLRTVRRAPLPRSTPALRPKRLVRVQPPHAIVLPRVARSRR